MIASGTNRGAEVGTARIFDVKKMAVHDGPGIRTTIFLLGCPLRCRWCHSPESMTADTKLKYSVNLCVGCGACVPACPRGCHALADGAHAIDREACGACGACVDACLHDALTLLGRDATVDELVELAVKDRKYFAASGGGVTLSGGEPLQQAPVVAELARRLKAEGIAVALDTSGLAPWDDFEFVLPHVDLVLFDVKETDPARHRGFTGADNAQILANLRRIDATGIPIRLRCPLVPRLNARDGHFEAIAALADELDHVVAVDLLPFHPYGAGKYAMIGLDYPLKKLPAVDDETAAAWVAAVQDRCDTPVMRG